jgi:4-hydroxybenzoate polyprenyltransferase
MNSRGNKLFLFKNFLAYLRVKDWLHVLGLTLLGTAFNSFFSIFSYKAFSALAVSALYLAHGFSLNNYFDADIDKRINKQYLPPGGKKLLFFSYSLFIVNCFISYRICAPVFYLVLAGSLLASLYSAPPFRMKKSAFPNIILNSAGFAIIFLIGFAAVRGRITRASAMTAALFALLFIPLQIVHQIAHAEADRAENILTLYNRYGYAKTLAILKASLSLLVLWSLLIGALYRDYIAVFYLTLPLSLAIFYFLKKLRGAGNALQKSATELRDILKKICLLYGTALILAFRAAG